MCYCPSYSWTPNPIPPFLSAQRRTRGKPVVEPHFPPNISLTLLRPHSPVHTYLHHLWQQFKNRMGPVTPPVGLVYGDHLAV